MSNMLLFVADLSPILGGEKEERRKEEVGKRGV